jgi:hypothetical protein
MATPLAIRPFAETAPEMLAPGNLANSLSEAATARAVSEAAGVPRR